MRALSEIWRLTRNTCIEVGLAHWSALGADGLRVGRPPAKSLVDPEALLLMSLYMYPHDEQLREAISWWAAAGGRLASIPRIKAIKSYFPPVVTERLATFADEAEAHGRRRWRTFSTNLGRTTAPKRSEGSQGRPEGSKPPPEGVKRRQESPKHPPDELASPDLLNPASLVLRLRMLFGTTARADVLAYLLGRCGEAATIPEIVDVTGYSRSLILSILNDFVGACTAWKSNEFLKGYSVAPAVWQELLGTGTIRNSAKWQRRLRKTHTRIVTGPTWLCWCHIFSYLTLLHCACEDGLSPDELPIDSTSDMLPIMWPSARQAFVRKASELSYEYKRTFYRHRIPLPPTLGNGDEYIEQLCRELPRIVEWCTDRV